MVRKDPNWKPEYTSILLMIKDDLSLDAIAQRTGYSESSIYRIRASSEFQKRLIEIEKHESKAIAEQLVADQRNDPVRLKLKTSAQEASMVLRDLLVVSKKDKDKESIQERRLKFDVAKDILDRTGYKAVEVVENRTRDYSPEELEKMQETMLQMKTCMERLSNQESRFLLTPGEDFSLSPSTDESSVPLQKIKSEPVDD